MGKFLVPCMQDLVDAVLGLMGLKGDAVSDGDSLANLGIDSMQLMEVTAPGHAALLSALKLHATVQQ